MPYSVTQESFPRSARDKVWVGKIFLQLKECGHSTIPAKTFKKYKYDEIFAASQCGFPVRASMKLESVAAVFDDINITLTSLILYFEII